MSDLENNLVDIKFQSEESIPTTPMFSTSVVIENLETNKLSFDCVIQNAISFISVILPIIQFIF